MAPSQQFRSRSSVNEQLERLAVQMREAHLTAQEAAKAISSYLKSLKIRKIEIGDTINASSSALLNVEEKLRRPRR